MSLGCVSPPPPIAICFGNYRLSFPASLFSSSLPSPPPLRILPQRATESQRLALDLLLPDGMLTTTLPRVPPPQPFSRGSPRQALPPTSSSGGGGAVAGPPSRLAQKQTISPPHPRRGILELVRGSLAPREDGQILLEGGGMSFAQRARPERLQRCAMGRGGGGRAAKAKGKTQGRAELSAAFDTSAKGGPSRDSSPGSYPPPGSLLSPPALKPHARQAWGGRAVRREIWGGVSPLGYFGSRSEKLSP